MTREEEQASLKYLIFFKRNQNGTIKGRGCANGHQQREHIEKYFVSAPTVATEALLLTCVIDAMEGRDVVPLISLETSCKLTWRVKIPM